MYVLMHLLGQKLNMCSHRFIALGRYRSISLLLLMVPYYRLHFFFIRMPNCCACAHTDRLDQFTDLYFGFSFRSGSSGLAGQFQVVEREFYQASPLPETVRTGNLKLQPTIPDHTLHDMTCRPVSVQLYSPPPPPSLVTSTAAYLYGFCAGIYEVERLMCSMGERLTTLPTQPMSMFVDQDGRVGGQREGIFECSLGEKHLP